MYRYLRAHGCTQAQAPSRPTCTKWPHQSNPPPPHTHLYTHTHTPRTTHPAPRRRSVPLQVKRTEGVSTTDIVGRMLTCSRVNHFIKDDEVGACVGGWVGCGRKRQ